MAGVLCVGHAVQDFVFSVPQLPARGEKYRATRFELAGGGPAATAAVTIAKLGGRAHLAARVGADVAGDLIVGELRGYGVDCAHVLRVQGLGSSVSAVMVDAAGERMIVNHLPAAMPADAAWLPDPVSLGVHAVLADTRWPDGAFAALRLARAAGLPGVLDADRPVPRTPDLLSAATHVAFSAEGLEEFVGDADPERSLTEIARHTRAWLCVTLGAEGVLVRTRSGFSREPAHAVAAVDTLGAGDVWHGAFALALAEARGEPSAVRFASAAAALKVQRFGGRAGVPTRIEVDDFLESVR